MPESPTNKFQAFETPQRQALSNSLKEAYQRLGNSLTFKTPWIDAKFYSSINAAITAIGSTVTTLVISNVQTLTANLTIPSNIHVVILNGGSITKASTYTLTINSKLDAGHYQIFSGFTTTDDILWSKPPVLNVKWFGAKGDNSTTNEDVAINKASEIASNNTQLAGKVYIPNGIYHLGDSVLIDGYIEFYGDGRGSVLYQRAANKDCLQLNGAQYCNVHDFAIASDNTGTNGLNLSSTYNCEFSNIFCRGVGNAVIKMAFSIYNNFVKVSRDTVDIPGLSGTIARPIYGLYADELGAGQTTNLNNFISCKFNGVSGQGIRLIKASVNTFTNCSTEGSTVGGVPTGYGVYIDDVNNLSNTFISHYFEPGTYGTAPAFDNGNGTLWIKPFGYEATGEIMWAAYGTNRYFTLHPSGNYGLKLFTDTEITRTGADALGLASGDTLDLQTNSNAFKFGITNGVVKAAVTTGLATIATEGTDYYKPGGVDVAVADGGTGASTASTARSNLGLTGALLGDTTDGRVVRSLQIYITNGTNAATANIGTSSLWQGDVNAAQNNVAKNATTGVWTLSANGSVLTLLTTGITGDCVAVISGVVGLNLSGTAMTVLVTKSGSGFSVEFYNAANGTALDITTLVDTGDIYILVSYVTSA